MVPGGNLPPGLLGRRRPAQPLLPRNHPAQAPEASKELPGAHQERSDRLGAGPLQAVVDCRAKARSGNWSNRDPRLLRFVSLVEEVEEPGGSFDEVRGRAEVRIALDFPKTDQKLVGFR